MGDFLTICEQAARIGGSVLQDWAGRITVREKAPKDMVTEADLASQLAIRQVLLAAFPDHGFLGEETDPTARNAPSDGADTGFRWIVDPLDGTLNYIRGTPSYAVSIALEESGELLVGVVFDPMLGECFTAAKGEGAFLNGEPIRASGCRSLREALVAVSFSANVPRDSSEIRRFIEVLHAAQSVRRTGSAALNLCYVGSGRLDAYFASSLHPWDMAAGVLIAREAGAMLTGVTGREFDLRRPDLALAATAELHAELKQILARAE